MMASNTKDTTTITVADAAAMKPPEQGLKCPRCDSSNTKFCYYNNYSLSQPRHYCKACRRYWTKGGSLRNVPVGGGCRKSKKSSRAALFSSTTASTQLVNFNLGIVPAGTRFVGLNYPIAATALDEQMFGYHHHHGVGGATNNNIASSIESLSSINQDLHWKLQQQRLAMMFGDAQNKNIEISRNQIEPRISFQVGEGSSKGEMFGAKMLGAADRSRVATGSATTAWFFDNGTSTSADYNTNGGRISINGINNTDNSSNASEWNGVPNCNWSCDVPQFSALP